MKPWGSSCEEDVDCVSHAINKWWNCAGQSPHVNNKLQQTTIRSHLMKESSREHIYIYYPCHESIKHPSQPKERRERNKGRKGGKRIAWGGWVGRESAKCIYNMHIHQLAGPLTFGCIRKLSIPSGAVHVALHHSLHCWPIYISYVLCLRLLSCYKLKLLSKITSCGWAAACLCGCCCGAQWLASCIPSFWCHDASGNWFSYVIL